MFAAFAAAVPVKRVGRPEDIAQTVLCLMNNSFTTGSRGLDGEPTWTIAIRRSAIEELDSRTVPHSISSAPQSCARVR